jgi:hypothetical protein
MREFPDGIYLDAETGKSLGKCLDAVKETTLWKEHMMEGEEFHYNKAGILIERIGKDARQCVANIIDVVGWGDNLEVEKIVDLKVVADTTPHAFRNQIDRMRWDVQAASYVRMVEDITGKRVPFYWFVVRNTPPWTCAYYQMDEKWLDAAEDQLVNWIYEWFNWKNEKLDGNARCANVQTVTLSKPPWRT